jgi:hypothetical protein
VNFPPLCASGKRSRSSLELSTMNLGSCASYRHGGRDPLPTDLVVTPPFKTLTGEVSGTQSPTKTPTLRSTQQYRRGLGNFTHQDLAVITRLDLRQMMCRKLHRNPARVASGSKIGLNLTIDMAASVYCAEGVGASCRSWDRSRAPCLKGPLRVG